MIQIKEKISIRNVLGSPNRRLGGIELLRIVAMLLVMVVHADFFSIGGPLWDDIKMNPLNAFTRIFIQSISIVCVNTFVMISGWFGIRPTVNKLLGLLFQILFFFGGIYLCMVLLGYETLSLKGIAQVFMLLPQSWFVKAYILLFLISPVLNAFCENTSRKEFLIVLIPFFAFQTLYGWLVPGCNFFSGGYSTMSFIGLYLLMQYVRKHGGKLLEIKSRLNLTTFLALALLETIVYILAVKYMPSRSSMMYCYVNPIIIASSLFFFLTFYRLNIQSAFVNWTASSSFAVYLVHASPFILIPFYKPLVLFLYNRYDGIVCLGILFVIMLVVFIASVLIDKVRLILWQKTVSLLKVNK